ncbi:conserved hypothetical protein [Rippkaea orientalis PCC 8801]|uniref:Integral membrane protein-like protein n=1 Tax=Rippkaea orientalis (strain PCC 8801 / RF-1) TaxID=41431 RepID=B7JYL6_RIPO1|nr:UPF0104 family protein [Rippkaea orientalis]ACK64886.1 conserved hypothetical protein [Rippkaea orientalis PCC 8801]
MSKSSFIRSVSKVLPIALAVLLLSVSIKTIIHEFKDHSWQSIWQYLQTISNTRKMASVALTGLGYLAMTGYDILGFQYINQVLERTKIAGTAFISYAVGNTIGFSAFSGTAIRYHFYSSWGVSKLKIAQLIVFTHLTFWLGLFGVSGVVFLVDPLTLPKVLKLPFNSVHPIGFIFLALVAIYFVIGYFWKSSLRIGSEEIVFPSPEMSLQLIALAAVDWGLACGVLYLLLPLDHSMSYPGFFGIYILALTAGLMSTVPGGLGVFDTVILLLRPDSISAPDILGALIAYRIIYYILPLIIALGLFIIQHFQKHK